MAKTSVFIPHGHHHNHPHRDTLMGVLLLIAIVLVIVLAALSSLLNPTISFQPMGLDQMPMPVFGP